MSIQANIVPASAQRGCNTGNLLQFGCNAVQPFCNVSATLHEQQKQFWLFCNIAAALLLELYSNITCATCKVSLDNCHLLGALNSKKSLYPMDRKRWFEVDLTSTLYRHIEDQISRNLTLFLRTFVM